MDQQQTELEQLRCSLFQPNQAIKKRALALIHNEVIIEALGLLQDYLGQESDRELQKFGLLVLQKLKSFGFFSKSVATERLLPFLQATATHDYRLLALRGLSSRREPGLASLISHHCQAESSVEALALIGTILENNPDVAGIPLLQRLLEHKQVRIRATAMRGLFNIVNECLLPCFFQGLKDPDEGIAMAARQMLNQLSRLRIQSRMSANPDADPETDTQDTPENFSSVSNSDLWPLLKNHLNHPDTLVASLIREAVIGMADRGNTEAAEAIAVQELASDNGQAQKLRRLLEEIVLLWPEPPAWLLAPLCDLTETITAAAAIERLKIVCYRFREFLAIAFVCTYFTFGDRSPIANQACFRTLQDDLIRINTEQLLLLLYDTLPAPACDGDLFPLVVARQLHRNPEDRHPTLLSALVTLGDTLQTLADYPGEAAALWTAAADVLRDTVAVFSPFLIDNRLLAKQAVGDSLCLVDHWMPKPTPVQAHLVPNFQFPFQTPVLVSKDSLKAVNLAPFYQIDPTSASLTRMPVKQVELWEFFRKHQASTEYAAFLEFQGSNRK